MACKHTNTQKIGECKVCLQCGMTILPNGQIFFDRKIVGYIAKKRKKG